MNKSRCICDGLWEATLTPYRKARPSKRIEPDIEDELFEGGERLDVPQLLVPDSRVGATVPEKPREMPRSSEDRISQNPTGLRRIHPAAMVLAVLAIVAIVAFAGWYFGTPPSEGGVTNVTNSQPARSEKENKVE